MLKAMAVQGGTSEGVVATALSFAGDVFEDMEEMIV